MENSYLKIRAYRDAYSPENIKSTLTVGELIEILRCYDSDIKVIISNDNDYTFGPLMEHYIDEDYFDNDEEEGE